MNHLYPQIAPETDDERFMLEALKEAGRAYRSGEVPVGAVVVSPLIAPPSSAGIDSRRSSSGHPSSSGFTNPASSRCAPFDHPLPPLLDDGSQSGVSEGRIIARGHNQVELLKDASAHAEMLALTAASGSMGNWRLSGVTLYCTLEPCAMCLGAMLLFRIERLVWGAPDKRHGACGSWVNLLKERHPTHDIATTTGILEEPCGTLMQQFFQERRGGKGATTCPIG